MNNKGALGAPLCLDVMMDFRPAQRHDLAAVIPWIPDAQSCLVWAGPRVRFPLELEQLLQDLEFDRTRCYVLTDDDQVLAFGQIRMFDDGRRGHLSRIVVNPRLRGQGIGQTFVSELIRETRRLHCQTTSLHVVKENAIAISLYKKLGFVIPDPQPDTLREGIYYMQLAKPSTQAPNQT